jgi:hypothetical protein
MIVVNLHPAAEPKDLSSLHTPSLTGVRRLIPKRQKEPLVSQFKDIGSCRWVRHDRDPAGEMAIPGRKNRSLGTWRKRPAVRPWNIFAEKLDSAGPKVDS